MLLLLPIALACGDDSSTLDAGPRRQADAGDRVDSGPVVDSGPTSSVLCEETCGFSGDGECDDGGEGSMFDACELGTDCMDCGPRTVGTCSPVCGARECGSDGCGGSCGTCSTGDCGDDGMCGGSSGGCDMPARCDGNVAIFCEGIITRRTTCSFRCIDGACDNTIPESVTISANYGSAEPIFVGDDPAGLLGLSGPYTLSAELPDQLRYFGNADPIVVSPPLNGCDAGFSFTLNASEASVQISGSGPACVAYLTTAARDGVVLERPDIEILNSSDTIDTRLEMRP